MGARRTSTRFWLSGRVGDRWTTTVSDTLTLYSHSLLVSVGGTEVTMDRERLIVELASKGLDTDNGYLQVLDTLGRGGNGVAFLCSGDTVGELVAKIYIPPDKRDLDDQSLKRFRNEVKLATTIRHPYVIPAIGSGIALIGAYVRSYSA
jgi:hypothetical protein